MDWIQRLFRRSRQAQEFEHELQFHIDELTQENLALGLPPDEARRRALVEFGGKSQAKTALDDVHRLPILETFAANLRFAVRMMMKAPALSCAIILTLALGVGANTAVFSAIDAILLRPLPFPHGDQLMLVQQYNRKAQSPNMFAAPVRVEDWNRMNSTFQSITGYYLEQASEKSGDLPEKISVAMVAPRFLQVWGIAPSLGRDFTPDEYKFGGPSAVLISERLWRRRFNADPAILGKKLLFSDGSPAIVGVLPASFLFSERDVDVWFPVPPNAPYATRDSIWYTVIGRLRPAVTLDQARADLSLVQAQLGAQFPASDGNLGVTITPLKEILVAGSRHSLWILFAGVTLLSLIACSNIAGLLLARAAQREQEISIRFALGARRLTVIVQLLTEVFVLAILGSLAGLAVAGMAPKMFQLMARDLPRVDEISTNWRIVAYSLGCALAATLLCGIFPALRTTRNHLSTSLARSNRTQVASGNPLHWSLAGIQVALAVTLLVSAGLMVRSMRELGRVSPGFDPRNVLTLHISASWGETADMKGLTQRIEHTLETLRAMPGVEAAATSATLPGLPGERPVEMKVLEADVDPAQKVIVDNRFVSTGYFELLRIPLLAGETCRDSAGPRNIIVNHSFVETFFAGKPAIGHHLESTAYPNYPIRGEIRGVVADAREQGLNAEPMPTIYWCMSTPRPDPNYLIRTHTDPLRMAGAIRRVIHSVEPNRSVFAVSSLEEQLSDSLAENRMRTLLLSLFALTAIAMASVGLYATLAYLVTLRHREVGLRLALGAQRWQIGARFLSQGLRVCLLGCACGLAFAAVASRLLASMLYAVSPYDAFTMIMVAVLVVLVSLAALLIPATRAAHTDPIEALRDS